jgi:hypothetical protein
MRSLCQTVDGERTNSSGTGSSLWLSPSAETLLFYRANKAGGATYSSY